MFHAPLMIRKTALPALHNQLVLFLRRYPCFSHAAYSFTKDKVKCLHSNENEVYQNFYPGVTRYLQRFNNIFTTNYDYNLESALGSGEKIWHLHGEFGELAPEYRTNGKYYAEHKDECDDLIAKKISGMDHIYSDAVMSWSWLDKYGKLLEADAENKKDLFRSIGGQLEIVGLSPANDEHLFMMINNNPNIRSVVCYYLNDNDKIELPHHIKKPTTFKKVTKLWDSMK